MVVSYRLSIVTIALSLTNHSAAICRRMCPTLMSTEGGGSPGGTIWGGRRWPM